MNTQTKANIMVVDDTPDNLRLLADVLRGHGCEVRSVSSGKMALKAAKSEPPDLILLDINMPEMDGYEVCDRLKATPGLQDIPIIFISGLNDAEDRVNAFRHGAVDYVAKPFEFDEVLARVDTHLTLRRYQDELQRHNTHLSELVHQQTKEILATKEELSQAQLATIVAMSKLAEARDDDTGQHIERTQTFCRLLAHELGKTAAFAEIISVQFVEDIFNAAPLHDIGKVAISDTILLKPGKLTPEEFEIMKMHAIFGAKTLQAVHVRYQNNALVSLGIEIAHFHHEQWGGSGYPQGLAGDDIPLSARIMALADVYDALTSKRCYKDAVTHERSCEIIEKGRGVHFDPAIVDSFLAIESEFFDIRQRMND